MNAYTPIGKDRRHRYQTMLRGAATITFDQQIKRKVESDAKALRADWEAVGKDLRSVLKDSAPR